MLLEVSSRCRGMEMLSVSALDMKFCGFLPFIYDWKTVIAFCIQVVKTLVSQGYARSDRYGVAWFSASRGLVCYRRAGISVFVNLEIAWFQRCFLRM